jgi:hypothetical protein
VRLPVVILQSLSDWIEEPLLSLSILDVSSLLNIVSSNTFSNSLHWKSRSDVEWSISIESEVLVETLLFSLAGLVNIKDCPLLVVALIVAPDSDRSSFFVFTSFNIKDLVVLPVDKLLVLILEDLPPSRVSAPDLHVVTSSTAGDVPRLIVVSCLDSH